MRIVIVSLVLLVAGCQRADQAEHSAKVIADQKPAVAAIAPPVETAGSCGGMGSCNGSCGGQCGGAGPEVHWSTVPVGSKWTEMHVTGMHCGGCAKRIERALATVDGIVGAEIDVTTGMVKVATASSIDARGLAKPAIDALGYRVQ
jgi:copper chaperone CopZ